ncbi:MAG: hypothetical protein FJW66_07975 [Actinobacteria bacterium]|nr:hypothetical protein [Actinomycetota bacterium]
MARRVYIREIYFYVMCLIAVILFIVGLVTTFDSSINYVKPVTYMTRASMMPVYKSPEYSDMTQEQIDKLIDEEIALQVSNEKINALKGIFRGALLIIIAVPLFSVHWVKAQAMWRLNTGDE